MYGPTRTDLPAKHGYFRSDEIDEKRVEVSEEASLRYAFRYPRMVSWNANATVLLLVFPLRDKSPSIHFPRYTVSELRAKIPRS